ncbi:hypothetical protein OFDDKENP_00253 [Aeromonas phage B614]|nr:hypothetical protein OFDDKENP_00253 [Aeromonas phage B614]UYD58270.1 hypothetical protein JNEOFJEA_00191 [Aeromonas phage UP87]UYD58384.1 hypothetical protein IPAKJDPM_00041 [Aeromonas phage avDM14-QBC]UYD58600.1 hypothetical protein HNNIDBEH_00007 [Aeromonas phage avDM10-HWA]UYD59097.1 hypothetical protein OFOPOMKI_00247 [Aeromonas phage avDM7-IJDJ]UYD59909.1 hypothetical protein LEHPIFIF_00136 [Aeromonas phage avDM9-HANS]
MNAKFTTTYYNFAKGKPDHIISGSNTGEHTDEEIIAGIRKYVEGLCPLKDRIDENGIDTLKIRKGVFFPAAPGVFFTPRSMSMRYS